jgi:17beta-estradiol 17-dehydrogenase / very-long-chain 3-oxoacyl-CoA reductase
MASRGMNVIIISRSLDKLKAVEGRIRERHPGVEVMSIAYDFTDEKSADEFYSNLQQIVPTLEGGLGLLVNNVGIVNGVR